MGTVFDLFSSDKYDYLTLDRGTVEGNKIIKTETHEGVFKLRSGMVQGSREVEKSDATLHIHPEDYEGISPDELVGNGIRYNGGLLSNCGCYGGKRFRYW